MSMSCDCLSVVFDAIVLSKLLHASSAWFGFISVEHLNMIQKLLTKAYKWGLNNKLHCATSLFNMRDRQLFRAMSNSLHCLHHLLPPFRKVSYAMRKRGHPYELIEHKFQKTKCSYIVRSVFE